MSHFSELTTRRESGYGFRAVKSYATISKAALSYEVATSVSLAGG